MSTGSPTWTALMRVVKSSSEMSVNNNIPYEQM